MKKTFIFLVIGVGLIILGGIFKFDILSYFNGRDSDGNKIPTRVICQSDAKQCPDGTYVGRTGPNCEFAECSN